MSASNTGGLRQGFGITRTGSANTVCHTNNSQHLNLLAEIAQWRQLLTDGNVQSICRIRHANGQWRWIESSGSASERQGRRVFVIVSRDITERRRLEAQFLQSQKMESVGRLAGGIAHDFNNLLTAITGYTGLALDALPTDHIARSDLQEIQRAADRAARLTNQLLSFARKRVIALSIFSLNDLIRDMESLLRRLIGEEVVLIIQLDALLGPIRADPSQIEQVLVNLVVNARDAMLTGGTLTITTSDAWLDAAYARHHVGATAGAYALLSVSDTGMGMSPEVQAHGWRPATGLSSSTAAISGSPVRSAGVPPSAYIFHASMAQQICCRVAVSRHGCHAVERRCCWSKMSRRCGR